MKTERLQVRVTQELKTKLQKLADEDGRKISNYIKLLIEKELKEGTE